MNREHWVGKRTVVRVILFIGLCASIVTVSSCASSSLRPNSPEEHTKNFVQALVENPFSK